MIFSDLPTPAVAFVHESGRCQGFAQAGNRYPLFGVMRYRFPTPMVGAITIRCRSSTMSKSPASWHSPMMTAIADA